MSLRNSVLAVVLILYAAPGMQAATIYEPEEPCLDCCAEVEAGWPGEYAKVRVNTCFYYDASCKVDCEGLCDCNKIYQCYSEWLPYQQCRETPNILTDNGNGIECDVTTLQAHIVGVCIWFLNTQNFCNRPECETDRKNELCNELCDQVNQD